MKNITLLCCTLAFAIAFSSCANRTSDKAGDPDRMVAKDTDTTYRAEGSATSGDIESATEMARINAMTVLAGKIAETDSLVVETDSTRKVTTAVSTPLYDVAMADRRIFRNNDGTYSVWVLLEMKKQN